MRIRTMYARTFFPLPPLCCTYEARDAVLWSSVVRSRRVVLCFVAVVRGASSCCTIGLDLVVVALTVLINRVC